MHVEELTQRLIFVIHDFLSPEECEELIQMSESQGYIDAPITTAGGPVMAKDIRNNERLMVDDPALAEKLWLRAKEFLPAELHGTKAVGLNERLRFYRYDVGQTFLPHYDGFFYRNDSERSELTFMIYLNGGFEGGDTVFYGAQRSGNMKLMSSEMRVKPEAGKALIFIHRVLHEGAVVTSGRKYVLRSDVMYRDA